MSSRMMPVLARFSLALFLAAPKSIFALAASPNYGHSNAFAPTNNAHLEDNVFATQTISEDNFNTIIALGRTLFSSDAALKGLKLSIQGSWKNSTVNAYMQRQAGKMIIFMYGGLARRAEVSPASFAAVLCHELGHGLGGKPWRRHPLFHITSEGQSDYFAFGQCLDKMLSGLSTLEPDLVDRRAEDESRGALEHEDYRDRCLSLEKRAGENQSIDNLSFGRFCELKFRAGLELGRLLSHLRESTSYPTYETPDPNRVRRTQMGYPKTVQCRLDTFAAAIQKRQRPWCWFAD